MEPTHLTTSVSLAPEAKRRLLARLLEEKANQPRIYPLSFGQERVWFFEQLEPGSPAFNIPVVKRLHGPLNAVALEQSFNEIVRRHAALRTTFSIHDGQPMQVVAAKQNLSVPVVDLRAVSENERQVLARKLASDESDRPFDVSRGPLIRVTLLRLSDEEYWLLLTIHHIIADGWSLGVLHQELATLYEAYLQRRPSPLPELPIQFCDFAHWQRQWLQGPVLEKHLAFWKKALGGKLPVLDLPTDHPRPAKQTFRGAFHKFSLSADLARLLKQLSQRENATLFMTLLAAFAALLHRISGQAEFIIGSAVANRNRVEIENLIGIFINDLALRTDLSGRPTFRELLQRVREVALGALAHAEFPFQKLVEALQPVRDPSRPLLFQVSFILQNLPEESMKLSALDIDSGEETSTTTKLDLTLVMQEAAAGLTGTFDYNIDLFTPATITRMAEQFQSLLQEVVAEPERRLAELPLLTSAENIADSYPLSPMQQGMLFHSLYAQESGVDIEQLIGRVPENLIVPAFQAAWQAVVDRHPVLRTSFRWVGLNEPWQDVHHAASLPWEERDLRRLLPGEQTKEVEAFLEGDRRRGFDMSRAPLMRITLFRLAEEEFQFVWTFHHALLDGRSFATVLNEVFDFYEARMARQQMSFKSARPYRDFIGWLQQQDWSRAETFWRQTLKGFTAPTPLVVDRATNRDSYAVSGHGEKEIRLSMAMTSGIGELTRQNSFTLNNLVQGAWALLLSRYSGEEDVVFGAVKAGRRATIEGAESMVGMFINTLPIRVRIRNEMPVRDWLQELRAQRLVRREFEHTPLVQCQAWSQMPRGTLLFESLLLLETQPWEASLRAQGGQWTRREFSLREQTNFPLTLSVYVGPELQLKIEFDRRRFDQAVIERMAGHLKTLLEGMVAQLDQPLAKLPMLVEAERCQLLVEWISPRTEFPQEGLVHDLIAVQAERKSETVAAKFAERELTYGELNQRANHLALQLRKAGVGPDVLVGLCVERSLEMLVGILGILKAGGAYVPLDPDYPPERLAFMLADARSKVLVTQTHMAAKMPPNEAQILFLDEPFLSSTNDSVPAPVILASGITADHLAYVIYTSGSTGRPKGVMVTHGNLLNAFRAWEQAYHLSDDLTHLQMASFTFDVFTGDFVRALCSGAKLVLCPRDLLLEPEKLLKFMRQERVDCAEFVPTVLRGLMDYLKQTGQSLDFMRLLVAGSESWFVREYEEFHGYCGSKTRLINSYGLTETTIDSTFFEGRCGELPPESVVPIGRPFANTQIYVLDSTGQPAPISVPGELCIGGAGVTRGYLNRAELTVEKFVPNPFNADPKARLYKTGDVGRYLPDGNLELLGRGDNQVKIRGFRVELGEIEGVLRQHPGIRESAVVMGDVKSGGKQLIAYVVAPAAPGPKVAELRSFLKEKLPWYMVPAFFVMTEFLPLNSSGKVDRRALPLPDTSTIDPTHTFDAPRTPIETKLAEIWAEVLKVNRIGIGDNFFDLGGHSLLATQVVSRVRNALQVDLPLRGLFESPTVAGLAEVIVRLQAEKMEASDLERLLAEVEGLTEAQAQDGSSTGPIP